MKVIYKNIKEIKPYENNPRINDDAIEYVANSIKEFGFKQPIVIDKDNTIVAGHTRVKASESLGLNRIPCIIADDLTDEQIKAYRLADNKVAEFSSWDFELLEIELEELSSIEFNFDNLGFELEEKESELITGDNHNIDEDNYSIEENLENIEPVSKLGDIWQLGEHRLMCGDATNKEDVTKLMNGEKANLVFTDPPYGMKKENEGVLNDNLNFDDLLEFNKKWIPLTFENLEDNGSWYCWGIDEPLMDIYSHILKPMIKNQKITFRNLITWDKGSGQAQNSELTRMYAIADEKCLFVMAGVQGFNNNADNYYEGWEPIRLELFGLVERIKKTTEFNTLEKIGEQLNVSVRMIGHWITKSQWEFPTKNNYEKLITLLNEVAGQGRKEYEKIKQEYEKIKQEYYLTRAYFNNTHDNMNNVWKFKRTSNEERCLTGEHATPKPLALCGRAIKTSSRLKEAVLDVFGGSGSTLIACEQLDRKCYMMELDPKYVDVIINRWETLTNKKAILLN